MVKKKDLQYTLKLKICFKIIYAVCDLHGIQNMILYKNNKYLL